MDNPRRLSHWRSFDAREIDILVDGDRRLPGIEIKSSTSAGKDDFRHLPWFAKDGPGISRRFTGIVFYLGDQKLTYGDQLFALPVKRLWIDP